MYKIGIYGSAENESKKIQSIAQQLASELGNRKVVLITGASTGLPHLIASEASKNGLTIWGFSTAVDKKGQEKLSPDNSIYKKFIYIPKDFEFAKTDVVCRKYRNVTSTATCDAAIIISGKWGTLNEFTNLIDMGKIIGILTGTGGIADELVHLSKKIHKKTKSKLIFSNSPKKLVEKVILELKKRK